MNRIILKGKAADSFVRAAMAESEPPVRVQPVVGPIGDRDAYERDVVEAQAAYDANPSSMNHEDLYAAKCALRRHWPNDPSSPTAVGGKDDGI